MTTFASLLKSASRATLIGAFTGALALAALPAQAAPSLGSSLSLDLGVAAPQQGQQMQMKTFSHDDDEDDFWCADLTNKQIRKGLRNADFDEIDFVKELKHHRVRVEALYEHDGWVYSMRIDRCDGEVDQIKPLYEYEDFDIDFDD